MGRSCLRWPCMQDAVAWCSRHGGRCTTESGLLVEIGVEGGSVCGERREMREWIGMHEKRQAWEPAHGAFVRVVGPVPARLVEDVH